jgi:hypothetical protein
VPGLTTAKMKRKNNAIMTKVVLTGQVFGIITFIVKCFRGYQNDVA